MPKDISLLDKVKEHLLDHGYSELETSNYGGVWTHPDWDGTTDKIIPTLIDCFERETK